MRLYIDIHQSAKVWATPMLQLILKSDKVSRFLKWLGRSFHNLLPKYKDDFKPEVVEFILGWTIKEESCIE